MALGIMPTAAFAGKVQRIDFTVTEPVIGETPDTAINVKFDPNHSMPEGIAVSWRKNSTTNDPKESGWVMMNTGGVRI